MTKLELENNKTHFFLGTRTAPREIMLDNSILPKDSDNVRVSTPPRVITLNEHHFPSAADDQYTPEEEAPTRDYDSGSVGSVDDRRQLTVVKAKNVFNRDLFNIR